MKNIFNRYIIISMILFSVSTLAISQISHDSYLKESQSEEYDWKKGAYFNLTVTSFPSFTDSYWEGELGGLVRTKSELDHSTGAEIELWLKKFLLRGMYQTGRYKFKNSNISNHYWIGLDLGFLSEVSESFYGIFGFGYRNLRMKRDYDKIFVPDNSELRYTEPVIVIILRSNPKKYGFIFNCELNLSLRGMLNQFFTTRKENLGVSFYLDIGVRFNAIPLSITAGGELLIYQPNYAEKLSGYGEIFKKAKVDATYGATLKLSYMLKLW